MEGPSLYLAKEQLRPFKGQRILRVEGNTKIGKDRLQGLVIKDIFSWGKHLVFQFDDFAMRIHFLLFGTFEAVIEGKAVTGDYRRARVPRLALTLPNGEILMFNCSIKYIESRAAKKDYDFAIDIMSPTWDPERAYQNVCAQRDSEIADVLLDQEVFAGVGNIIKNEVLSIQKINPMTWVKDLQPRQLKAVISEARLFSQQFLRWRKKFVLRKNLKTHRRSACQHCETKLIRAKTGTRQRWSFYCPECQPLTKL